MDQTQPIVVVGAGIAGSAIAHCLSRRGQKVTLLCRKRDEGSSFTNQKWNHSGLLYPARHLAQKACQELLRPSVFADFVCNTTSPTRFLAMRHETLQARQGMWEEWRVREWGLNWRVLEPSEYRSIAPLGDTCAVGGFEVPDRIVDFPSLIHHLRVELKQCRGSKFEEATVARILIDDHQRVSGVEVIDGNCRIKIPCSNCILAAGAWSAKILAQSGLKLPDFILRKCVVFEYVGELVSGITTCLDVWRHDGTLQDVTLVPFRGKTLAAGTGFVEIVDGDDNQPDPGEVERLAYQLAQCFPTVGSRKPDVITCVKTEKRPGGKPNVSPQVYGASFHGVEGLTIAIPGKASFAFELASQVLNCLQIGDPTIG